MTPDHRQPDRTVTIVGAEPLSLPTDPDAVADVPGLDLVTRTIGFECASGDWLEAEWTGVPMTDLFDAASIPDDTTHLAVESVDGYRACLATVDLLDGLLALDAAERPRSDFPQVVSSAVIGPRSVKQIATVEPLCLDAGDDPESYEDLQLGED